MQVRWGDSRRDYEVKGGKQAMECLADPFRWNGFLFVLVERKQWAIGWDTPYALLSLLQKLGYFLRHFRSKGDQSMLSELRMTDQKKPVDEVHVLTTQSRNLTDTQAQAVKQHKSHSIDLSAIREAGVTAQFSRDIEKSLGLIGVEDKRAKSRFNSLRLVI